MNGSRNVPVGRMALVMVGVALAGHGAYGLGNKAVQDFKCTDRTRYVQEESFSPNPCDPKPKDLALPIAELVVGGTVSVEGIGRIRRDFGLSL